MNIIYVTRAVECPTLAEVSGYLERHGWDKVDEEQEYWLFMKGDECIELPNLVDYFEFSHLMRSALEEIAEMSPEGVHTADIYDDIVAHRAHENGAPGAEAERPTGGANEPSR